MDYQLLHVGKSSRRQVVREYALQMHGDVRLCLGGFNSPCFS